jgi:uncharacterized protein YmfQ (DUF2313 family)
MPTHPHRAAPSDYVDLMRRLWPRGAFRDALLAPGSSMRALIEGCAVECARMHNYLIDVIEIEADPTRAVDCLESWEQAVSLPDDFLDTDGDIDSRRAQVVARLTASGGSDTAYHYALLARSFGAVVVPKALYKTNAQVDFTTVGQVIEQQPAFWILTLEGSCPTERRERFEKLMDTYVSACVSLLMVYTD